MVFLVFVLDCKGVWHPMEGYATADQAINALRRYWLGFTHRMAWPVEGRGGWGK